MSAFTRNPGPLLLDGVRVADLGSLSAALHERFGDHRMIAADLSLGAWRTHQIASEIGSQLGLPDGASPLGHAALGSPAQSRVGRLIDSETRGDRVTLDALRLCHDVLAALTSREPVVISLLIPRAGISWQPADTHFVRFLAQALRSTPHALVLISCQPEISPAPADWEVTWSGEARADFPTSRGESSLAFLVPGVITRAVSETLRLPAADLSGFMRLPGDCFLVPPELRSEPQAVSADLYNRLALEARQLSWLAAYASYLGDEPANASLLWEHARREFEAGGFGIVILLLERAISFARTTSERAVFQLLAQGARIAAERFAEAALLPDPEASLPAELRGWLFHTKGWALTIENQPVAAEACLGRARELLRPPQVTDEFLYLMNISALNRLKMGAWREALAIEQEIRSALPHVVSGAWQLRYINSLNFARLYRRQGDWDAAGDYYREAFSTARGAQPESDAVYENVCWARLEEARGQPASAFHAWVRAALHWVCCAAPEAIGRRVTSAILGSAPTWTEGNRMDDVSAALSSHLMANAKAAHLEAEAAALGAADRAGALSFHRPDEISPDLVRSSCWHALPGPGGWVLGSTAATLPVISSKANGLLRAALSKLLATAETIRTVIVDDQLGHGLPKSEAQLFSVCLRLGISKLAIDGRLLDVNMEDRLRVRMGSAVSRMEHGLVIYKRYRDALPLSELETRIVALIENRDIPVAHLQAELAVPLMPVLRKLEGDRIVELYLPG